MRQLTHLVVTGSLALLLSACGGEENKIEPTAQQTQASIPAAQKSQAATDGEKPAQHLPEADQHSNIDPEAALEPEVSPALVN